MGKSPISIFIFLVLSLTHSFLSSRATQIDILNKCSYTVWAAADSGHGKQLNHGETWTLTNLTGSGRIWGRTNCAFDSEGRGKCLSGDCGGLLECKTKGRAPNTVAEYVLNLGGNDLINVSVVEGFNIPIEFSSASGGESCRGASKCVVDVNEACPMELRDPGGCNNPCTVFGNSQFCCTSGLICEPTTYSKYFKDLCPYASTYPSEGQRSVCPTGTDYQLVFCPLSDDPLPASLHVEIQNNCSYTVWAAAIPGGGRRLDPKENWPLSFETASVRTGGSRIWARTNCSFDGAGRGTCETGDCGGVLECQGYGQPPNTLVEYTMNQFNNQDFFDISLVDGFNVPVEFGSVKSESQCTERIRCARDINGDCPRELRTPGGCNNARTVYKTAQYCCTGVNSTACEPTVYSLFFKDRCPDAYSYPYDDRTSTFTCPRANSYQVVFCP